MKQLKKLLIGLAGYYNHPLTEETLTMYLEDLADLSVEKIFLSVQEIRKDPKVTRFPLPAHIRERIMPADNPEGLAIEAANRIVEAISKFGYWREAEAKEFVGSLGWLVVERQGGWQTICENTLAENITSHRAQWRELAKVLHQRSRDGVLHIPPALPGKRDAVPERISNLLKNSFLDSKQLA